MRFTLVAAIALCAISLSAQTPGTDIWVVPLGDSGGRLTLGTPRNLTARQGYDNQPSWSPRGEIIYYASTREDAQTDIWSIDVATGRATRVTTTSPESEYSPTVMPDGAALSVIRVERDSTQRLWRIPLDGSASSVILADVKPVGYHAWGSENTLGLFVLGNPATLQIADVRTGAARTVASAIGRGIAKMPGEDAISFVEKISEGEWWITEYRLETGAMRRIVRTMPGVEDYAWTPAGILVSARGSDVFALISGEWSMIGNLGEHGIQGITRLSVSPGGDAIALVARDNLP